MELRDALDQITTIKSQLARTERLRGLRALPVAFSGALAVGAALTQAACIADPAQQPRLYLLLWTGAAAISALAAALTMAARTRAGRSAIDAENMRSAVVQFAPCVLAGALVTAFVLAARIELLWLLPGVWQILFGLGLLAAAGLLPRGTPLLGLGYLLCGGAVLLRQEAATAAWAMGAPFAVGQGALAAMLWWSLERPAADQENAQDPAERTP